MGRGRDAVNARTDTRSNVYPSIPAKTAILILTGGAIIAVEIIESRWNWFFESSRDTGCAGRTEIEAV